MKNLSVLSVVALLATLSGCSEIGVYNGAEQAKTIAERHAIDIARTNTQATIKTRSTEHGIVVDSTQDLQEIVDAFERANGGTVRITLYGKNATNYSQLRAVMNYLKRAGIAEDSILIKRDPDGLAGKSQVVVSFSVYTAQAPDCSRMWTDNAADAYRNTARKGFGCATMHNLATMIVNPADLQEMRPFGYGLAAKRAKTYDQFAGGSASAGSVGAGGSSAGN